MPRFDSAIGRYVYLEIDGVEYRVYLEEAGAGIPLLLQHTAGADGRQWRHLLEDRDIGRHFRLIAYDLPYHAKSVPPPGVEWWKNEYALTRDFFMKVPVTLAAALELERPVFMGCSIGGHLAADLACFYPGVFRAAISLEGALRTPAKRDLTRSEEHTSELQSRPHLVCRLLLEKKKKTKNKSNTKIKEKNIKKQ